MFSYLLRRLLYAPLIIVGVMLVTFAIFFVFQSPENMARVQLGKRATPTNIAAWISKRGYDKPVFLNLGTQPPPAVGKAPGRAFFLAAPTPAGQVPPSKGVFDTIFFNEMGRFATLNLGVSDVTGNNLKDVFRDGAIPSLLITFPAFVAGFFMAVGCALFLVFVRKSMLDTAGVLICVALMSIPAMVYIIFGQAVVALAFNYFPAFGFSLSGWNSLRFLLLPVALIVVIHLGSDVRLYRAVFLEEISQDYVRTAQAKGVSNTRMLFTHVLKNGMIALITLLVAQLPVLILGSLLVENFFGIPGLGNLLAGALQTNDFAVVKATTFLTSILYIIGLTATDICYALADPRIRLS
jgi:peptide/nickel transport system permease protein